MEQNFSNNRGNGYNGQNRNNVNDNRGEIHHAMNNNNQGGMNVRPEVNNTCAQSGKSTWNGVAQSYNRNKTAYRLGFGTVLVAGIGGLGYWAFKKLKSRKDKKSAPAAVAEPKPAQEAAGESK